MKQLKAMMKRTGGGLGFRGALLRLCLGLNSKVGCKGREFLSSEIQLFVECPWCPSDGSLNSELEAYVGF